MSATNTPAAPTAATAAAPIGPAAVPFGRLDLALLAVAVIWGANFVVIKSAVAQFDPMAFAALRFCLATAVMVPPLFTGALRGPRLTAWVWVQLFLLGLVGNVLYQPAATLSLRYTTATNAALIISTAPAWVAVLGHLFGVERLGPRAWLGVGLSALGLGLVVAGDGGASGVSGGLSLARENMLGNALSLAAALGWAGSTLMMRPLVLKYSSHSVVVLSNLLAIPPLLALAVPGLRGQDWGALTLTGWAQLAVSALLAVVVAYSVWARGVQRLGAARTALYGNLVPVFAALAGLVFLGETLTWPQLLGAALVLVGIGLARQK